MTNNKNPSKQETFEDIIKAHRLANKNKITDQLKQNNILQADEVYINDIPLRDIDVSSLLIALLISAIVTVITFIFRPQILIYGMFALFTIMHSVQFFRSACKEQRYKNSHYFITSKRIYMKNGNNEPYEFINRQDIAKIELQTQNIVVSDLLKGIGIPENICNMVFHLKDNSNITITDIEQDFIKKDNLTTVFKKRKLLHYTKLRDDITTYSLYGFLTVLMFITMIIGGIAYYS